jgi:hypothetical protein
MIAVISGTRTPEPGELKVHIKECARCQKYLSQEIAGDLIEWMGSMEPGALMKILTARERSPVSSELLGAMKIQLKQVCVERIKRRSNPEPGGPLTDEQIRRIMGMLGVRDDEDAAPP